MTGQGVPGRCGRGQRTRNTKYHPHAGDASKRFKSAISEIAMDTVNMGQKKFVAQFPQSQKNVANYLQHMSANEGDWWWTPSG